MRGRLALSLCFTLGILFAIQLAAQEASPLKGTETMAASSSATMDIRPSKTVNVLLLKSWGVTSVWEDLKTNWSKYGKIALSIDDSTYINTDFTYQDLVNSKANVLVISNPSGNFMAYSSAEVAAVAKYAKKGHPVIGTYLVFEYSTTDNRALAPIFGLDPKLQYSFTGISNLFDKTKQNQCLFKRITGNSWQSQGYADSQIPATGNWTGNLHKAKAVAESDSYVGVITTYKTTTYTGVFISNFPEYNGGTDDEQLLYNASTCYVK
jgi:hypothetical protein